jgi:mRNA-degrading endonuclease RelE of RelBE toxin-antitoxin system
VAKHAVELSPRAASDLEGLSAEVARRILRKLRSLEDDPRPRGDTVKVLQGFDLPTYRLRIGDYRAVHRIRHEGIVVVLRIIHRSELERALRDLA